jgi:hypothetical protein
LPPEPASWSFRLPVKKEAFFKTPAFESGRIFRGFTAKNRAIRSNFFGAAPKKFRFYPLRGQTLPDKD